MWVIEFLLFIYSTENSKLCLPKLWFVRIDYKILLCLSIVATSSSTENLNYASSETLTMCLALSKSSAKEFSGREYACRSRVHKTTPRLSPGLLHWLWSQLARNREENYPFLRNWFSQKVFLAWIGCPQQ